MVSQYLPKIGGIELVVSDLSQHLVKEGHEIHVVTPYPVELNNSIEIEMEETFKNVHIHRFIASKFHYPFSLNWIYAMYKKLKNIVETNKIEIIHAHFAKNEGIVSSRVGRKLGVPVITTAHGTDLMFEWGGNCETRWSRYWVKNALKNANMITTVSDALKQNAIQLGNDPNKIQVIHNWIDPSGFAIKKTRTQLHQDLGWDNSNQKIILSSRRLVKKNGIDLLINAMKYLNQSNNLKLLVIGRGPEKNNLIEQSKKLNADIEFLDFVEYDQYIKMLNACDVYVVPSRWEGFGMVILEAMSAKTAVIGTNVGGIPEIIKNDKTGILVSPNSKSIAEGVKRLFKNKKLEKDIVENAYKKTTTYFSWPRAREQWLELYSNVKRS
jgi:N-acetyl-alpha-D-glucosaminyl L-malate synthase BshA